MAAGNIIRQIAKNGSDKEKIARKAMKNPDLVPELLDGLNAERARIKYGCEKVLRIIGEEKPELLYPHFNVFVKLLDGDKNFLKWGAIITIANLARVDSKKKFERIFARYFSTSYNTLKTARRNARMNFCISDTISAPGAFWIVFLQE